MTMISERGGSRVKVPEGKGELIDVRLMGWEPGSATVEGSSADYPVDKIQRDFASAFPAGTRMRANHDGLCEAGGDIRRIMAKTVEAPRKEADGMYAKARVREGEATDFIRQFADVIGTSVSVGVELEMEAATDDDGEPILDHESNPILVPKKSERGANIVKRFLSMEESPYNAVDFVEAPGADGRIVAIALESARETYDHTTLREAATFSLDLAGEREKTSEATPPRNIEEEDMTDEERKALIAESARAGAEAALEAVRPSVTPPEQPTLGQQTEAVITAGLTEAGRAEVYTRLERGETLESAIAAEKAREANIDAEVERRLAERQKTAPLAESAFDFGYTTDDKSGNPLGTEAGKGGDTLAAHEAEFEAALSES